MPVLRNHHVSSKKLFSVTLPIVSDLFPGQKKKKNVLVQAEIAEVSPVHQLDKEAKSWLVALRWPCSQTCA